MHIVYMTGESFFTPAPASRRAVEVAISALRARGHTVTKASDALLSTWMSIFFSCVRGRACSTWAIATTALFTRLTPPHFAFSSSTDRLLSADGGRMLFELLENDFVHSSIRPIVNFVKVPGFVRAMARHVPFHSRAAALLGCLSEKTVCGALHGGRRGEQRSCVCAAAAVRSCHIDPPARRPPPPPLARPY